jgi:hypothetical protein
VCGPFYEQCCDDKTAVRDENKNNAVYFPFLEFSCVLAILNVNIENTYTV